MPTILITEDDRVIRNLLEQILAEYLPGFEFETRTNGEEAVTRMLQNGIDLVIMDLRMPRLDGIEAIDRIRDFSDVPIIVVSAYGDDPRRKAAKDAGATMFFQKPPKYQVLAGHIKRLVRQAAAVNHRHPELRKLYDNLNYLTEQSAKHGGFTPLALRNEIQEIKDRISEIENGEAQ